MLNRATRQGFATTRHPRIMSWVAQHSLSLVKYQCLILTICSIIMVAAGAAEINYIEDTDRFPGWKGELPQVVGDRPNTIGYGEGGVVSTTFPVLDTRHKVVMSSLLSRGGTWLPHSHHGPPHFNEPHMVSIHRLI